MNIFVVDTMLYRQIDSELKHFTGHKLRKPDAAAKQSAK